MSIVKVNLAYALKSNFFIKRHTEDEFIRVVVLQKNN